MSVIQKVKDGQPLEELPPAKYAEPPPFPKNPMPNNVVCNSFIVNSDFYDYLR